MLYVTRKPGESVMIDNHIELTVLSIKGNIVRLGISSSRPTNVLRKELYDAISQANREASSQHNAFLALETEESDEAIGNAKEKDTSLNSTIK